jgi:hypothetical protein
VATAFAGSVASSVEVRYKGADRELRESTLDRVDVDEVLAGLPVREFRWFKGRQFYSGWYWSATGERLVAYESRLELARIMLADFAPDVVGIASQPFQLIGRDAGRLRRHVPDLLLVNADGLVTVVDVKPASRLALPRVREVFDWTGRLCGLRGWSFEVWSGADARLLANVAFLAGFRRPSVVRKDLIGPVLAAAAYPATVGEVERALSGNAPAVLVRSVVCHLLWRGRLIADMSRPIDHDTELTVSGGGIWARDR